MTYATGANSLNPNMKTEQSSKILPHRISTPALRQHYQMMKNHKVPTLEKRIPLVPTHEAPAMEAASVS